MVMCRTLVKLSISLSLASFPSHFTPLWLPWELQNKTLSNTGCCEVSVLWPTSYTHAHTLAEWIVIFCINVCGVWVWQCVYWCSLTQRQTAYVPSVYRKKTQEKTGKKRSYSGGRDKLVPFVNKSVVSSTLKKSRGLVTFYRRVFPITFNILCTEM